ncbi:hypothetical protein OQH60_01625 [Campylobacter sp. MIT 21-1685]|uniref:hypothetical protein n=1 Tax=unclassified Campylobacter TaxID=2593542 RepID=UPI00224B3879|nr:MULTISPECIES: hypothetical protein [unclassified Campylobacter]MCX2682729.1 hypothetical protein [Campylobacter sp. MIT 21-1684]MCX2751011.1 hypothetical protein [Campylobacter sp. MIT 21-1682]MCX2807058.1 hypothetical protein [Campylobacter sp. MIT 21-1685]
MEMKFFKAGIQAEFSQCQVENTHFLNEYLKLGTISQLNKWKKLGSRVDFEESERLIFDLLLSLKEDVLRLESALSQQNELLPLEEKGIIDELNFEYINFLQPCLNEEKEYYLRFELKNQQMAVFLKAENVHLAKIIKIKPEDRIAYDAFVVELQRNFIREKKG